MPMPSMGGEQESLLPIKRLGRRPMNRNYRTATQAGHAKKNPTCNVAHFSVFLSLSLSFGHSKRAATETVATRNFGQPPMPSNAFFRDVRLSRIGSIGIPFASPLRRLEQRRSPRSMMTTMTTMTAVVAKAAANKKR